ncbi:hypothetical protein AAVH_29117 [Aphelenchoides avenae]|nr:hypothetical protein AAVH_29117 [Aphelenchus avenae]
MKVVGKFATCVIDAINVKRLPVACVKPIATRQYAEDLGVLEHLHHRVGTDLYDVYRVHNERANADLSVLIGIKPWRTRIVLMPGTFRGSHQLEDEEEYLNDGEGTDYDH